MEDSIKLWYLESVDFENIGINKQSIHDLLP